MEIFSAINVAISVLSGFMAVVGIDGILKHRSNKLLHTHEFKALRHLYTFYTKNVKKRYRIKFRGSYIKFWSRNPVQHIIALILLLIFCIYSLVGLYVYSIFKFDIWGIAFFIVLALIAINLFYNSLKSYIQGGFRVNFLHRVINKEFILKESIFQIGVSRDNENCIMYLIRNNEMKPILTFKKFDPVTEKLDLLLSVLFLKTLLEENFGSSVLLSPDVEFELSTIGFKKSVII